MNSDTGQDDQVETQFFPAAAVPGPGLIVVRGDRGSEQDLSGRWEHFARRLAGNGVATTLVDFDWTSSSEEDAPQLTVSRAGELLSEIWEELTRDQVDPTQTGLLGSGLGGAVVLGAPTLANRAQVVGLRSPASFPADHFMALLNAGVGEDDTPPQAGLGLRAGDHLLAEWLRIGYSETLASNIDLLRDSLLSSTYSSAAQVTRPILITHGTHDTLVPVRQSIFLAAVAAGGCRLELLREADHCYSDDQHWDRAVNLFETWFLHGLRT